MKRKRSFFEKLTGAVRVDDDFDDQDFRFEHEEERSPYDVQNPGLSPRTQTNQNYQEPANDTNLLPEEEGELSVDVVNSQDEIVIKAMVAGVRPQDLDIQISRDMVTIHGTREETEEISEHDYYHKELYWGSFSRNILLPEEIDVEASDAKEKHGLLEIHLPKVDKARKTKLSVKSS